MQVTWVQSLVGELSKILHAVQNNQKIFKNYFNEKKSEILLINKKLKKL